MAILSAELEPGYDWAEYIHYPFSAALTIYGVSDLLLPEARQLMAAVWPNSRHLGKIYKECKIEHLFG